VYTWPASGDAIKPIDLPHARRSLDRGTGLWLASTLRRVGDYLTGDVDPKGSDRHMGILLASVIHPDTDK
jgi:hypothetical protein